MVQVEMRDDHTREMLVQTAGVDVAGNVSLFLKKYNIHREKFYLIKKKTYEKSGNLRSSWYPMCMPQSIIMFLFPIVTRMHDRPTS